MNIVDKSFCKVLAGAAFLLALSFGLSACNERTPSEQKDMDKAAEERRQKVIKNNPGKIPKGCEVIVLDVPGSWLYALVCDARPSISSVYSYNSGKITNHARNIWVGDPI